MKRPFLSKRRVCLRKAIVILFIDLLNKIPNPNSKRPFLGRRRACLRKATAILFVVALALEIWHFTPYSRFDSSLNEADDDTKVGVYNLYPEYGNNYHGPMKLGAFVERDTTINNVSPTTSTSSSTAFTIQGNVYPNGRQHRVRGDLEKAPGRSRSRRSSCRTRKKNKRIKEKGLVKISEDSDSVVILYSGVRSIILWGREGSAQHKTSTRPQDQHKTRFNKRTVGSIRELRVVSGLPAERSKCRGNLAPVRCGGRRACKRWHGRYCIVPSAPYIS